MLKKCPNGKFSNLPVFSFASGEGCVLVTSFIAVTKYQAGSNLRKDLSMLAHSLRVQSITAGKAWQ